MHRATGTLPFLAAAVALCACGSKEAAKPDSSSAASQAGAPAAGASMASYDPATHTVTLHTKDFAFDAPDSIPAGWTNFHLVNDGPNIHHAQIVRLDSGKTVADLSAAMKNPGPPPAWAVFVAGPNAPDPHSSSDAAVNLQPGNYVLLCLVDIPDRVPHFAKGMIRPLKVVAASGPAAAEPTSDISVILSDYSFTVSPALTVGKHTVKIMNKGPQMHELELVSIDSGKTVADLAKALFDTAAKGPPPGHAIGGIPAIAPGLTAYAMYDLKPGHYAMLCFLPTPDGKGIHMDKGMIKEFTIK